MKASALKRTRCESSGSDSDSEVEIVEMKRARRALPDKKQEPPIEEAHTTQVGVPLLRRCRRCLVPYMVKRGRECTRCRRNYYCADCSWQSMSIDARGKWVCSDVLVNRDAHHKIERLKLLFKAGADAQSVAMHIFTEFVNCEEGTTKIYCASCTTTHVIRSFDELGIDHGQELPLNYGKCHTCGTMRPIYCPTANCNGMLLDDDADGKLHCVDNLQCPGPLSRKAREHREKELQFDRDVSDTT